MSKERRNVSEDTSEKSRYDDNAKCRCPVCGQVLLLGPDRWETVCTNREGHPHQGGARILVRALHEKIREYQEAFRFGMPDELTQKQVDGWSREARHSIDSNTDKDGHIWFAHEIAFDRTDGTASFEKALVDGGEKPMEKKAEPDEIPGPDF